MPLDLNGNKLLSTSIGPKGEVIRQISTDGLLVHLDAGNINSYAGSGTTWTDLSGKGYNGTLTNGPTFSTDNKGVIVFDGSNDYVTTADIDHGTSQFTLETWVYFSSLSTAATLIKKNTDNDYWPVFSISVGTDGAISGYYSSQVYGQCLEGAISSTSVITTGQWYHLCYSKGAAGYTTMKIHRNAVSQSYSNFLYGSHVNNVCNSSKPVMIGINFDAPNFIQQLNGRIAVSRIYNRQLSDLEILQNYNSQKSRFGL